MPPLIIFFCLLEESGSVKVVAEAEEIKAETITEKEKEEVKKSEQPVSRQKTVQDWINQPYESHLKPLEDPSVILTSPQFPRKKYTESKRAIW